MDGYGNVTPGWYLRSLFAMELRDVATILKIAALTTSFRVREYGEPI